MECSAAKGRLERIREIEVHRSEISVFCILRCLIHAQQYIVHTMVVQQFCFPTAAEHMPLIVCDV